MTEHDALYRAAANQIDELDRQIADLNDGKKVVYDNLKETVPPADFRAWKDAVKLRRKSAAERDKASDHDMRVFAILASIEAIGTNDAIARAGALKVTAGEPPAAVADAGTGAVSLVAHPVPDVPHDPVTGEVVEMRRGARAAS